MEGENADEPRIGAATAWPGRVARFSGARLRHRFLHSTGQAYKGGPNSGVFLQITADGEDLAIPGQAASFG
jgi:hypothetical protein